VAAYVEFTHHAERLRRDATPNAAEGGQRAGGAQALIDASQA
jgi:hypothetical protein